MKRFTFHNKKIRYTHRVYHYINAIFKTKENFKLAIRSNWNRTWYNREFFQMARMCFLRNYLSFVVVVAAVIPIARHLIEHIGTSPKKNLCTTNRFILQLFFCLLLALGEFQLNNSIFFTFIRIKSRMHSREHFVKFIFVLASHA